MRTLYVETPVISSQYFAQARNPVWLKLDNLQPIGSFKIRGISQLCQHAKTAGFSQLVSSSGGNAGLATAYSGKILGISTTVVVPTTTSKWAQTLIKNQGAQVFTHGLSWSEADIKARELVQKSKAVYVPPFDHPKIVSGHSTIIDELTKQIPKPSAIILSVGGGGLMAGVIEGLKRVGWNDVKIYASEPEGAASFAAAVKHGQPVIIDKISTHAVTLGASKISQQAFELSQNHPVISKVVSECQALKATIDFANYHRMLVEPSCGAALALLEHDATVQQESSPLVIICGGVGVNTELIYEWEKEINYSLF